MPDESKCPLRLQGRPLQRGHRSVPGGARPEQFGSVGQSAITTRNETEHVAWDDVSRWQPVDLVASFRMGDAVQPVDVRDLTYRDATTQVKGAIRIDPMAFEAAIAGLPEGKEIIFYCDRPGEATSMKIALWAFDHGRGRVGVLVGGWPAWETADHPQEPIPSA